ncbi:MAG: FkbM family methyltransferase [Candidatus Moranbacteria bacterium]|nr:FkbM family methyltransferase [Candidatus Moranbacteria bacterium]
MEISKLELSIFERLNRKKEGKLKFQPFYENLLRMALRGMNIGGGGNVENSGEIFALKYIGRKLASAKKSIVVFDVGANKGKYSQLVSKILPQGKIIIFAFEPSLKTYKKLVDNCLPHPQIKPVNCGLSDKKAGAKLFLDQETSEMASIYQRRMDHFNLHMNLVEEIKLDTLDNFCAENKINRIDLLKLDVEGNELKALEGAKKMLTKGTIKFMQLEFGGCNIDSRTFFQDFYYLLKDKYVIYRIVKDGLHRIKEYQEIYELFITTNFLAELRNNNVGK